MLGLCLKPRPGTAFPTPSESVSMRDTGMMKEKTRLEEKAAPFYLACIAQRYRSGKCRNLRFLPGFGTASRRFSRYLQPHS